MLKGLALQECNDLAEESHQAPKRSPLTCFKRGGLADFSLDAQADFTQFVIVLFLFGRLIVSCEVFKKTA